MAHKLCIETETGKASMFYVDEPLWHGLGTRLANSATSAEAIKAANLDCKVQKKELYLKEGEQHLLIKNRYAVTRPGTGENSHEVVLGAVGRDYTPLQNSEAFTIFDNIVGKGATFYHTAGAGLPSWGLHRPGVLCQALADVGQAVVIY